MKSRFFKKGELKDKEIVAALHKAAEDYENGEIIEVKDVLVDIINSITDSELAGIMEELYVDDAVDIVGELPANVVKRVMRAAFDTLKPHLRTGFLIVISAREAIRDQKSTEVARELEKAFRSLNMLHAPEGASNKQP